MDVGHIALKQINFELRKKFYSYFMFNQIAQRAKSIMYISDFTKSEFNKYVGKPKNSEFVTLLGVDKEWFNIKTRKALHSFPYLLYVGNVKPHKNLKILIEAYEKICNKIQLKLVIVGKKEGFITSDKSLFDKSDKIGNEIIFTGEVTDSQLKQYFKQAKLFVFPSLYEGFGLPPLEAMASGIPVISSSAASLPEVCGNASIYFDPKNSQDLSNKILAVLSDNVKRETMIKKGYERAKLFTWDKTAILITKIINKIAKENK